MHRLERMGCHSIKQRMKKILFCYIILLFAFGCRKSINNNNSVNENATDIFPNKIGDTWFYLINDTTVYAFNGQSNTIAQCNTTISVIDSVQQLPESIHGIQLLKVKKPMFGFIIILEVQTQIMCIKKATLYFFSRSVQHESLMPGNILFHYFFTIRGIIPLGVLVR